MTNEANGANGDWRLWLLFVEDGVSPDLHGPYATEDERVEAARTLLGDGADDHGVFRIDAAGAVEVGVFGVAEVEP